MRDPKRIPELMDLLTHYWQRYPDLRFNQLIYNLQSGYSKLHGGVGQVKETDANGVTRVGFDLFNLTDDGFIEYLRSLEPRDDDA